jgi:hypothetical protein
LFAVDFDRPLAASPTAVGAAVVPAETGAASPVLITIAAATGALVAADEAAADETAAEFGAPLSSLSSFALLPDEVLTGSASTSAETPAGFTPAGTAAASPPAVSCRGVGLSAGFVVAVGWLLLGCVVGLPAAGVAEFGLAACWLELPTGPPALLLAEFAFPTCAPALPPAVFVVPLPLCDAVFAVAGGASVSVMLATGGGVAAPPSTRLAFVAAELGSVGGEAACEMPLCVAAEAGGGGPTGGGDNGSEPAVLASSRAAKDCVSGSGVAAAACCHCEEASERAIPTSDAILDTVRIHAKPTDAGSACNRRATTGHAKIDLNSMC